MEAKLTKITTEIALGVKANELECLIGKPIKYITAADVKLVSDVITEVLNDKAVGDTEPVFCDEDQEIVHINVDSVMTEIVDKIVMRSPYPLFPVWRKHRDSVYELFIYDYPTSVVCQIFSNGTYSIYSTLAD